MSAKIIFENLATAAVGNTGKEAVLGGVFAFIATFATAYLGGWDQPLKVLIALMIADYATGVLGAMKQKNLNSDVMFWGGVRKGIVILVIGLASMVDQWMGNGAVFRTIAIYFYAGREGLSVVENFGILGVPFPSKLTQFLTQLQEKGEGKQ